MAERRRGRKRRTASRLREPKLNRLSVYHTGRLVMLTHHTGTHHVLNDDDDRPNRKSTLLSKAVEEDFGHGLANGAVVDRVKIRSHAECQSYVNCYRYHYQFDRHLKCKSQDRPQPSTPAIPIAYTIAHGTAIAALEASSLMCTLASKEPTKYS